VKIDIKKISIFIVILLSIGVGIIYTLFKYNISLKNYFANSNKILQNIDFLKEEEYKLNFLVLKTTFYLYENNDNVVKELKKIDNRLDLIKKDTFFKKSFSKTYQKFLEFAKEYEKDKTNIYRFFTYNSLIKNSTMYLMKSLSESVNLFFDDREFLKREISVISSILIAKNSLDKSFLNNLNLSYFSNIDFQNKNKEKLKNVFLQNLILFNNVFSYYFNYLKKVEQPKSKKYLKEIYNVYYAEKLENVKRLNLMFDFIIVVLIGGIAIVTFLLYLINKEHFALQKAFITDSLTSLGNREKFNRDVKKYQTPTVYLININKFKHINDIYGSEIGDEIIKMVGNTLVEKFYCANKRVYRIGGDEFAILCNGEINYEGIIEYFNNNPIKVNNHSFNISVSIGISKEFPLIETADMALKQVKKDMKIHSLEYVKNSELKEIYKEKIKKGKILQEAIKNNLIIPVFQPIFYNENNNICKYEVLARIKTQNGLISIFPFLEIAKENKVYKEITKAIYLQSFEVFKNREDEFSLNLSIEDIVDNDIRNLIDKLFENESFASRCTFELLESEAIEDYEIVKSFIKEMKKKGVKFAIDDFGSGYSNFEHILNLEIDYLKIDGSLIKKIKNKNTQIIVKTINDFAKQMNIHTIAEFVSDKEIFEVVKSLNIECSQGFHLSLPFEKI